MQELFAPESTTRSIWWIALRSIHYPTIIGSLLSYYFRGMIGSSRYDALSPPV